MSLKVYKDGNMLVLESTGEAVPAKRFVQPQSIFFTRQGEKFLIIETEPNKVQSILATEIQNSSGTAMADGDAAEAHLTSVIPSQGGGPFAGYEIAAGVYRWNTTDSNWRAIDDNDHTPTGFGTPTMDLSARSINIPYSSNFTEILTSFVVPDEQFIGMNMGATVGLSDIKVAFSFGGAKLEQALVARESGSWGLKSGHANTMTFVAATTPTVDSETIEQIQLSHSDCSTNMAWCEVFPVIGSRPSFIPYSTSNTSSHGISGTNTYVRLCGLDGGAYAASDGDAFAVKRYSVSEATTEMMSPNSTFLQNQLGNFWVMVVGKK